MDGNVLRVFSRLLAENGDITRQKVKKEIGREVRRVLPAERAGDFNQALMDLGSAVCLPNGQPLCGQCPWENVCQAHKAGRELDFPVKARKKARKIEEKGVFLIEVENVSDGSSESSWDILLHKRPPQGLLPDLWEFPNAEGKYTLEKAREYMEKRLHGSGYIIEQIDALGDEKHIFSHVEWHMSGYRFRLMKAPEEKQNAIWENARKSEEAGEWIFVSKQKAKEEYAIPSAFEYYKKRM